MAGIDVVFRFTQTQQVDVARPEPCPEQSASREDSFIHAGLAVNSTLCPHLQESDCIIMQLPRRSS